MALQMPEMLQGKTVIVTGAGRGLGREYAYAAARAGAAIVVNDIEAQSATETVDTITRGGGTAVVHLGSVSDPEQADELISRAVAEFGHLDGLVNNAGILSPGPVTEQPAGAVRRTVDTNFLGSWWCGSAALRVMLQQGSGSIVNVVSGAMQGIPGLSLYGATKAGVTGMTYGWALEVADSGVRVNAISPLANTPMSNDSGTPEEIRGGDPESVAPAIVYLLSDRSRSLNGQIIRFDGRRLGVVQEPHLSVTTNVREWDSELIAAAFDGALAGRLRPVGLAVSLAPDTVEV